MGNLAGRYVDVAPQQTGTAAKREPSVVLSNKRVATPALSNKSNRPGARMIEAAKDAAEKAKNFDKRAYQREYMRKRRAEAKS